MSTPSLPHDVGRDPRAIAPLHRMRLLVGGALGCIGLCAACGGYAVTATDGRIFQESATMPDSISSALLASASRDLPCGSEGLDVTRLDPDRQYQVTGCGRRVLYRVLTPSLTRRRVELISRTLLSQAIDHPAS